MYFDRVLEEHEALFVSRAQQKIADLGASLALEFENNDVTNYKAELINELQYAIDSLRTTDLTWTADEIQLVIDYYTIEGELKVYPLRELAFNPTPIYTGFDPDALQEQIDDIWSAFQAEDDSLLAYIQKVESDYQLADIDIWNAINNISISGGGITTKEITAGRDVGSIESGTVFPIGTPIEDVVEQIVKATTDASNLSFTGLVEFVEVNSDITVSQFTWDSVGEPTNLTITDSEGVLNNQPVTGNSYTPGTPITYDMSAPKTITWTLSGDNIEDVVITTKSIYASYFDKEVTATDNPITVTEAKILGAITKELQETEDKVDMPVDVSSTEQGFIAVPKLQSQPEYTKWRVNDNNQSEIASGEFIRPPVDVTVNGVVYSVYRWGYRSPLTDTLTLYR